MQIHSSILELIGNTPIVNISRFCAHYGVEGRILAKLENLNPSGSKKDRIALHMIVEAEKSGRLSPGQKVVEETSGNTGNSLAMVCAVKGYPFVAAMSKGNSSERMKMMRGFGADLLLVDQLPESRPGFVSGADMAEVEAAARTFASEQGAYMTDQFYNPENNEAHALSTAREIMSQTDGQFEYFADFAGTGGTFAGTAKALKEQDPSIRCVIVEPACSAYYGKKQITGEGHRIQGGGYGKEIALINPDCIDAAVSITDEEAIEAARLLASLEGIFAGFSAGANAMAAIKLLRGEAKGKTVVVLIPDTGLKYLSANLFE